MVASRVPEVGAAASVRGGAGIEQVVHVVPSVLDRRTPSKPTTAAGPAVRAWKSDWPPRRPLARFGRHRWR